jgi:beta-alanine--pyruvate transaminase
VGRERGYHGVNFGGMSVGGIPNNRAAFGPLLPHVDHIRHTHDPARNAFARGQPPHGAELATTSCGSSPSAAESGSRL